MSSLRNAVNRRVHRERAQPQERSRFGLLEKHKDYTLRAKDHNRKKKTLANLRAKAADKNEDEFFFGMLSRGTGPQGVLSGKGKRWTGTVDGDRGNRALDVAAVRLLKTQDVGYLRTVRGAAAKEARQLEERVVALGGSLDAKPQDDNEEDEDDDWLDDDEDGPARRKPKKIVFTEGVEAREEQIAAQEDEDEDMDDDDEVDTKTNPKKLRAEQRAQLLAKLQRRLAAARKKVRVLSAAENELEMQRARMAKTATVGGVTKAGKKFKIRERKR